ncbi:MAG: hypothetical protein GY909_02055 [Oligoflexia bacterium]|nr:hypothetical protein [Oligoflexia bacterium]
MREKNFKTYFVLGLTSLVLASPILIKKEPTKRQPASLEDVRQSIVDAFTMRGDFIDKVESFDEYIDEKFHIDNCSEALELPIRRFKKEAIGFTELRKVKKDPKILKRMWDTRQKMLSKFKSFHSDQNFDGESCIGNIKTLNYELRYAEDYLGSHLFHQRHKNDKSEATTFSGVYPNIVSEKENFEWQKDLKSGDIFITKGNFFFSGSLAKIGKKDTHFSHQGIIYKNEGTFYTAEAHPEVGATVRPLEDMNNNDRNVRTLVMRYKNEKVSDKAGLIGYSLVKDASDKGVNIPYDFWMNFDEEEYIFCSELVTLAFDKATAGKVQFPMYKTEIELKESDFAKKLGIESQYALHPGDLEYDPDVETVVEWRDYSRIMENLVKDEILHKLYEWMEVDGYKLINSAEATIHENVTYHVRKWPIFGKLLEKEFPTHMPQEYIGTVLTLQAVGHYLFEELMNKNVNNFQKKGRYLSRKEMHAVLEKFRKKDYKRWKSYISGGNGPKAFRDRVRSRGKIPLFHLKFNPGK